MQNFLSLGYMLRVLLAVSANFPDNPRIVFVGQVVMFLDSYRTVFTFYSWLDLLGVTQFFILKSSNNLKTIDTGLYI